MYPRLNSLGWPIKLIRSVSGILASARPAVVMQPIGMFNAIAQGFGEVTYGVAQGAPPSHTVTGKGAMPLT